MMARTAGSRSNVNAWLTLAALAGVIPLQPSLGCAGTSPDAGSSIADIETSQALLEGVGTQVVLPTLDRFLSAMDDLDLALQTLDVMGGTDGDERAEAQDAWFSAMTVWQELELMQIGPAGNSLNVVAGADLRDEIYSWPTINACRVDQVTANEQWEEEDFFSSSLVNSYGMDALEYLLHAGPDTDCPGQVTPVADGLWEDLGELGVAQNRVALSLALTDEISRQARVLRDAWDPDDGDFSGALAGSDASPYGSNQQALNAIFDALYYLDTTTKDQKIGTPLGLTEDCGEETCIEEVEGRWSDSGLSFIQANLQGFELLFTGGDGTGMDDLLVEVGHGDLAAEILANLDAAHLASEAVDGTLAEAIEDSPDQAEALYDAVKSITDLVKGDLATVLSLQLPSEGGGDTD
ncbi:MAG: imelysin family protein [Myxococcota bacterium]|jgi:predicted lipoprotein|nr:imelysin family protein [Myxococcota bacterium]